MAKIMLVEDDNNLREIYGARLLAEGHEIVAAKDGEEALALAVKEKPELIISDVMMPRISGFDMLDILRNAPETKNTKVIMMTALSQAEDKARADKLGADRYLVKSQVTLEDVAKAVRDVLEDKPPADTPITGASGVTSTEQPSPDTTPAASTTTQATPTPGSEPPVPQDTPPVVTPTPADQASSEPAAQPVAATPAAQETVPTPPVTVQPEPVQDTGASKQPVVTPTVTPASTPAVQTDSTVVTATPLSTAPPTTPVALDPPTGPATSTSPSIPEPVTQAQTTTTTPATPAPMSDPTTSPVAPDPGSVPAEAIKVELPQAATEESTQTAENPDGVGPTLNEALQEEATEITPVQTAVSQTPEMPEPSIVNGAESVGVISPTATEAPETPPDVSPTGLDQPEPSPASPLDDTPKKKVIEPINDLTKKPDLAALAAAEEGVGNVVDPSSPDAQVVEPDNPTPPPATDHNKIAL